MVGKNGVGCTVSVVGCEDALATSFMWPVELDAGRLKPRPIKVGDRVTWGVGVVSYDVFGIREGYAVLTDGRCVDGTPYLHREMPFEVQPVSLLVKV